jgi:hypothetical protein
MAGLRLEVSRSPVCRTQDYYLRPCLCRQTTLMVCISGQHDQLGSAFGHPEEQVLHTVVHFVNCWQFMCVGHLGKRNKHGLPVRCLLAILLFRNGGRHRRRVGIVATAKLFLLRDGKKSKAALVHSSARAGAEATNKQTRREKVLHCTDGIQVPHVAGCTLIAIAAMYYTVHCTTVM